MAKFKINIELEEDYEKNSITVERTVEGSDVNYSELFSGFVDGTKGLGYYPPDTVLEIAEDLFSDWQKFKAEL